MAQAQIERQGFSKKDSLIPHQLSEEGIAPIRALFAKYPLLEFGYLAQKRVRYFPDSPYLIVGLRPYRRWYKLHWPKREAELMAIGKQIQLPRQGWIMLVTGNNRYALKKFLKVPGSEIYRRAT